MLTLTSGRVIKDKIRFFHGDHPSAQLEAGHQKGGNYFCPSCPIKANLTADLEAAYRFPIDSLASKISKLLEGPIIIRNNIMNKKTAFSNMSHETYVQELVGRNMDKDIGNITDMKKKTN